MMDRVGIPRPTKPTDRPMIKAKTGNTVTYVEFGDREEIIR